MRTQIVRSTPAQWLFFFLLFCTYSNVGFAQIQKEIIGKWEGSIGADGWELKIMVEFHLDKNGTLKGDIDVPAQGFENVPLEKIVVMDDSISFIPVHPMVPENPGFDGKILNDRKSIAGIFTQGGAECAFTLKRITDKN